MGYDRGLARARWRLPRALGAAVLTAGVLAAGLPAGTALASPASPGAPTALAGNSLAISTNVKILGHTWTFDAGESGGAVFVSLGTTVKGVTEEHDWTSTTAFAAGATKELKVTSTGHATWKTGSALNPVLAVSLTFAPTKVTKMACVKGSETTYAGKVSGTVTLATGLRAVTVHVKFSGQPAGELTVDKACMVKPGKNFCLGSGWFLSGRAEMVGVQVLGTKPSWADDFSLGGLKTASKWLTRGVAVLVNGSAPKLNTAAKTVTVGGLSSGGITGTAVISYSSPFTQSRPDCFVGGKKFKETDTSYFGTAVKVTKPFQAHSLLAGTLTLKTASTGIYTAVKLTAA
jgi:hypothetical protein